VQADVDGHLITARVAECQPRCQLDKWQGPATRFRYSMEVLDGHALGNDRYVVFIRLVGNFPGGVADFAERFTVQDGHIAELDIALRAPGSPAGETSVR